MKDTASVRYIGPRRYVTPYAQQLRDDTRRGPISLAAHNPQPYDDIDDNEAAS